jgi:hypothetical protein
MIQGDAMTNANWTWANLTDSQLQQVVHTESTLGADYLLAYQPDGLRTNPAIGSFSSGLQIAPLTDSLNVSRVLRRN